MVFLEVRYKAFDHVGNPTSTHRTIINVDSIRRVGRTQNGWAKIYWTIRVDALVLDETYQSFIDRLSQEYGVTTLPHDD